MPKKEYMTRETFEKLEAELELLVHTRRKEVATQLEAAKSNGDLSENAEYHEAREQQAAVEYRIGEIEELLKNAEIVAHKAGDTVDLGATVTLAREGAEPSVFTLVSTEEADAGKGKISYQSPLGQALLNKKKGDHFEFVSPKGSISYTIEEVK
ncbi:MAG TPA: transcription elongation factor GreA [Candidatus Paceibacterota bacterium]